jgi:hypothetical protein
VLSTCNLIWHSRESTRVISLSWYEYQISLSLWLELQLGDDGLVLPLVVLPYGYKMWSIHPYNVCMFTPLFNLCFVRLGLIDWMVNLSRFASDLQIDKPWGNTLREELQWYVRLRFELDALLSHQQWPECGHTRTEGTHPFWVVTDPQTIVSEWHIHPHYNKRHFMYESTISICLHGFRR